MINFGSTMIGANHPQGSKNLTKVDKTFHLLYAYFIAIFGALKLKESDEILHFMPSVLVPEFSDKFSQSNGKRSRLANPG